MSEHTKGRLVVKSDWLIPADQSDRPIGGAVNKERDRNHYANIVATVSEKYHDQAANARRLAACWNAFDAPTMTTEMVEALVQAGGVDALAEQAAATFKELTAARALIQQQDSLLGKKACATKECGELLAARALLREVLSSPQDLDDRIRSYLDACDTMGDGND